MQFTLRSLLVVTTVFVLACWYVVAVVPRRAGPEYGLIVIPTPFLLVGLSTIVAKQGIRGILGGVIPGYVLFVGWFLWSASTGPLFRGGNREIVTWITLVMCLTTLGASIQLLVTDQVFKGCMLFGLFVVALFVFFVGCTIPV